MSQKQEIEKDYDLLTFPGNLGFYTRCEVTSIFLFDRVNRLARNFYTLIVFEEADILFSGIAYITPKLIELDDTTSIGIARFYEDLQNMRQRFAQLLNHNLWSASGVSLDIGDLEPLRKQFAPLNGSEPIPINSVLKNNFDRCSYLIEFFDVGKPKLGPYAKDPVIVGKINEVVKEYLSLDLLYISDRIGNVVFQFPITILTARKRSLNNWDGIQLEIAWHPRLAQTPNVSIQSSTTIDKEILGFGVTVSPSAGRAVVNSGSSVWEETSIVYNPETNLILDLQEGFFVKGFGIGMSVVDTHSSRSFITEQADGTRKAQQLTLASYEIADSRAEKDFVQTISERIYEEEKKKLVESLAFVQYGKKTSDRSKALQDIRSLIQKHGQVGVYLWDPFLCAEDILDTLYFCNVVGSQLKAIGSYSEEVRRIYGKSLPILCVFPKRISRANFRKELQLISSNEAKLTLRSVYRFDFCTWTYLLRDTLDEDIKKTVGNFRLKCWIDYQRNVLQNSGNNLDIDLEFRCRHGNHGWNFHDRFLVFPTSKGRPRAWSLGTSVNALGKEHHVVQEVSNARLIQDAFEELWDALSSPECLVWKSP